MSGIAGFAPKSYAVDVTLLGGSTASLTMRPYILADKAWWENNLTPDDMVGIEAMKIEPLCKIVWNQLDAASKALFEKIEFEDTDGKGNIIVTNIEGYRKLMHAVKGVADVIKLYGALIRIIQDNDFLEDDSKKKKSA